jgi:hypothetical protein
MDGNPRQQNFLLRPVSLLDRRADAVTGGTTMNTSTLKTRAARLIATCALAVCATSAFAQYGGYPQYGPGYLPPPPPPQSRYWQAYHEESLPNYAARWGFRAGEIDGQRDRETGHSFRPVHDDGYKHVPSSNGIPVPRGEFKGIYREAYVHGYEAGYGR